MDDSNDSSLRFKPTPVEQLEGPSNDATIKHTEDSGLGAGKSNVTQMKDLLDFVLDFLSSCSNERLLLVLACLAGVTYIILGRLGLLLIGTALGVALHASWEKSQDEHSGELQSLNRKQTSLNVVQRLLEWERNKPLGCPTSLEKDDIDGALDTELDISSFGPATATALQSLIDAAMRDYVNHWYDSILPSELSFPTSCRKLLSGFITSVSIHLSRKQTTDTFLEFLTNSSSMVIVFLNELSAAFEAADPGLSSEDAIVRYLESNPESNLSSLLTRQQQHTKLGTIADDVLSRFLEPAAYNCFAVRNFLREILVGVVFDSSIANMSKPEFINRWITYLFSEGESEIMSAIDAGVEGARNHGVTAAKVSGEFVKESAPVSKDGSIVGSSSLSDQAPRTKDPATEEAMLEAKRLSELIAAQGLPKYAERMVQPVQCDGMEGIGSDSVDGTISNTSVASSSGELHGPLAGTGFAGEGHDAKVAGLSESSSSLVSPCLPSTTLLAENIESSPAALLHRALVKVDDSADPGDKSTLRSKPTSDYLIQVEPRSGRASGWMVFKRYVDFESIHDTLGTISRLNQLRFGEAHPMVPPWKGRTKQTLARDLERYLQDALQLEPLAESATMRRFLERETGLSSEAADSSTKAGFVFPGQAAFENVGKGVLGVLSNAPKGVSGGGKAVLEGVTGVFSGVANRKSLISPSPSSGIKQGGFTQKNDESVSRASGHEKEMTMQLRPSSDVIDSALSPETPKLSDTSADLALPAASFTESSGTRIPTPESGSDAHHEKVDRASFDSVSLNKSDVTLQEETEMKDAVSTKTRKSTDTSAGRAISVDETRMAVELIFAVINELYSLSSAWNIRRTLLNAAKTYILRPGNPSLETIRQLLQDSIIDSNTTDEAIGMYLAKLRENAMPTAEELSSWPAAIPDAEKERQREAARRALVQRGLPQAITSVMGAVASREALGKVFDSLQVEVVARGFVFSILLQALRAIVL
ncbi:PXA domain-containing protein [Aspergillus karnatakaensis]|uniref:PX domain protein n=1 Tax=Aspergillus karnatakaensis TaxID=1810916 RepID=UPI003CCD6966